ncbi:MAG TPA: PAS domain S-box protein [Falsiroseomonas sp.]|jgi:PAS domain S-box-containing protein|nr:PAS domain S-box protein [Falsiroseomonas sp.]
MPDLEQMAKRQRVLADFGEFVLRSESLDEILTEACRLVGEALGTERAKILEIEHESETLLVRAGVGWKPEVVGSLRLSMREHSSESFSIEAGKPVITRDIREEDRFDVPAFMKEAGVVALANVPIFLPGGQAYGLLQVDSREQREFGEADSEFLRTYAALLGPVIDRLHKQRKLRATEQRFRLIVESARDYAIFVADTEDRITDWFPGAEAVFGWTADEAVGQPSSILFTPEDRATHIDEDEVETARARGVAPNRRWHLRRDGTRVFIEGTVTALRGEDGELRGFLKIGQDVTERRRTDEQLRESEERLRALVTATSDVLYRMSPDWTEMRRLDGRGSLSDTASPSRTWLDECIHPDDQPQVRDAIREAIRTKTVFEQEHRVLRTDGSLGWTLSRAVPLLDARGEIREWFGAASDVTARKRTEEALRESEARFRHMADSAPALIWMTDAEGTVTFANMHFEHMFGRPAEEMLGDGWARFVPEQDLEMLNAGQRDAFQARGPFRAETRVRDRAGRVLWVRSESVPRLDDAGRFLGYTGCGVDITDARLAAEELERRVAERTAELMSAEETIRQAQKMEAVGQLTGGIAHDFNNMLQGVAGGLEMARRRLADGRTGAALRYLEAAREAAERAAGLTRRLLAFARRQRLEPRPVDTDRLVAGLADLIRRTVGPGVRLELRLRDGGGSVLCDPNELESALLNLVINARDAMPGGGRLAIATEDAELSAADIPDRQTEPGKYVAISVADTGAGIPPEVLGRVFEPFFTTKPQGQGTGLGLSQVYGFLRQSGGLVRIESAPGQGTTVRLLLPLHEQLPAAEEPGAMPPQAGPGRTVLLVDDEDAVRRPVADRLRELGHTVLEARDGPAALRILASARPDLLVSDVGLPRGMNGRQVAEAVRERMPGLPVLFITGYAGAVLPSGVEVIEKPFELDALAQRVQAMLQAGGLGS